MIDATALKLAASPFVYIVWLFVLNGITVSLPAILVRRHAVLPLLAANWKSAPIAGLLGTLTYGLALLAFTLGAVVQVATLREMSIVFAALYAVSGVALMHLSG